MVPMYCFENSLRLLGLIIFQEKMIEELFAKAFWSVQNLGHFLILLA